MAKSAQEQVEHRMRFDEILGRAAAEGRTEAGAGRKPGPFVTISRQAGSGGRDVAAAIARRLKWTVLDRELVAALAEKLELDPQLLQLMDETRSDWLRDTLLNLMNSRLVVQDNYVSMLGKIVLLSCYQGKVVIVGRGANLIVPREGGLRVRIIADEADCVARLCGRDGLSEAVGQQRMRELEASRADFVRRHFHRDVADPDTYDMTLSSSTFGIDGCAELIIEALRLKGVRE